MSFDGVPSASCAKTPCKAELREGSIRIIAALEQYETADTMVSIRQNNQNINIKLKPNFGVLEIKPAYQDGIGKDTQWNLTINSKPYSLGEIRLSPNKYSVRLSHECYENIGFDVGINKGSREVFDMAGNITPKKGGLSLSAEKDGEPASEPVFVNGRRVGETPFSGTVPVCARVEIGDGREAVDVKLKYNEKVTHTHSVYAKSRGGKPFTDSRDGKKYKTVTIGKQVWMAENLSYNANGSKCYDNSESNCAKYGRLYNWNTAKTACPKGWHLPSDAEWTTLTAFVGGSSTAGTKLKAKSSWNSNGNGTDEFGFSALPGGNGYSDGSFDYVGIYGHWWSATEYYAANAWSRYMGCLNADVLRDDIGKALLYSVRCAQDSEIEANAEKAITIANSFTDPRDKKTYKSVIIGEQTWMAENLNYNVKGSKCYSNQESNCQKYGRLYNWNTAKTACPKGWHLPSKNEWGVLTAAAGGEKTEGEHLKATSGWNSYRQSGNGTDTFGFAALPGGNGDSDGRFSFVGKYGHWWSSGDHTYDAYYREILYTGGYAYWRHNGSKDDLRSVRCVRD